MTAAEAIVLLGMGGAEGAGWRSGRWPAAGAAGNLVRGRRKAVGTASALERSSEERLYSQVFQVSGS